jgi:hypothetical protein
MPVNATFEPQSNGEVYSPSSDFLSKTNASALESMALRAEEDLSGFWAERAKELELYQPWNKVLDDSNKPFYKWFVGGKVKCTADPGWVTGHSYLVYGPLLNGATSFL